MSCAASGWGTGPYSQGSFSGSLSATPGGPIPASSPFDIYCVEPCGPMSVFDSYNEVAIIGATITQAGVDVSSYDYRLHSGTNPSEIDTIRAVINVNVPNAWTFETTFMANALPDDLLNPTAKHFFFGTVDQQGLAAGLFFTVAGIYYTSSVDHDGSENLQINGPVQYIPDSVGKVLEGNYYTLRIAVDLTTETTYVYLTKTTDLPITGHQLLAILPGLFSASDVVGQVDGTVWSVKGILSDPVDVQIDSICLGTGLIIPNFPPVAVAGDDQVLRTCAILQLDGTESFDPEGSSITYAWRLIVTPETSTYSRAVDDGSTFSPPVAFTNKFHSVQLSDYHTEVGIEAGDVLHYGGVPYTVSAVGTDGNGFYVQITEFSLPTPLSNLMATLVANRGVKNPTSPKPAFYPDVPGVYRFDLQVYDGTYYSEFSETLVNVTDSPLPRGVVPDVSFLWNYLLDFWNLVEEREQIQTFWSSLAQIAAGELLTLWQHEYGKSLRDIQRVHNRKWLHYDLYLPEPGVDLSEIVVRYAGVETTDLIGAVAVSGVHIFVETPLYETLDISFKSLGTLTSSEIADQLRQKLTSLDSRFVVTLLVGTGADRVAIWAPFSFTIGTNTNAPFLSPATSSSPQGTGGVVVGSKTYRVERSLAPLDVKAGDALVVDGIAYIIQSIETDPADPWTKQRIVVTSDVHVGASSTWYIPALVPSPILDFYKALVAEGDLVLFEVENLLNNDTSVQYAVARSAVEADTGKLLVEPLSVLAYLALPDVFSVKLRAVHRRRYMPLDPLVSAVPYLQEKIVVAAEEDVLHQNADYFLDTFRGQKALRFVTPTYSGDAGDDIWEGTLPPQRLWSEFTYIDNSPTIEANFGIAAGFTLDDLSQLDSNADYLSIVRGLWYSHLQGPTLRNLRVGAQILLGLPFVEEAGTITEINEQFSAQQGRILVKDTAAAGIVRSYEYPRGLALETNPSTGALYKVGDTLAVFDPLVQGVEVDDWVKNPLWMQGYVNQGLLAEVEKFHTFLVRVDSEAFNLNTLLFVQSFIKRIKPRYTHPFFLVGLDLGNDTTVSVTTEVEVGGTLYLMETPCQWLSGADGYKQNGAWDESPGGPPVAPGTLYQVYDGNAPPAPAVYPNPVVPVYWGFDKKYLCPSDAIYAEVCLAMNGVDLPQVDSIWAWDSVVFTDSLSVMMRTHDYFSDLASSVVHGEETATAPMSLDYAKVEFHRNGIYPTQNLNVVVEVNASVVATVPFTVAAGIADDLVLPLTPIPIIIGDVVRVYVTTQSLTGEPVPFTTVLVRLGTGYVWAYDVVPPADTYCTEGAM